MKKIGIITSGGDAPGMNAAIRAVVRQAIYKGLSVIGIERGFIGLLNDQFVELNARSVGGIINLGGTILKTGRCAEIRTAKGMDKAVNVLKNLGIEGLVIIGGDGSLHAGNAISKRGVPVMCIPGSIDNDVYGTDETIGFDTACDTAIDAVDKIRDTASSHERIFIIEVMGREHGFLALSIGLAAGAEYIMVPEIKYNVSKLCASLHQDRAKGKTSVIIIFAEGAGNSHELAREINKKTGCEARVSALGYIQRGGSPTARSRILASLFGARAVDLLAAGKKNRLVVLQKGVITDIPVAGAAGKEKPFKKDIYCLARQLAT